MRELLKWYCVTPRGLLAVAALGLLGGVAAAQTQTFAKPGDGGTIEFPVENDSTSGLDATGVQLAIRVVPATLADRFQVNSITIKEDASAPPITVAIGQSRTFVVNYTITQAAQDGDTFQVFLDASIPNNIVLPDPSTWGTNVSFPIEEDSCVVERRALPVSAETLGFHGVVYMAPPENRGASASAGCLNFARAASAGEVTRPKRVKTTVRLLLRPGLEAGAGYIGASARRGFRPVEFGDQIGTKTWKTKKPDR